MAKKETKEKNLAETYNKTGFPYIIDEVKIISNIFKLEFLECYVSSDYHDRDMSVSKKVISINAFFTEKEFNDMINKHIKEGWQLFEGIKVLNLIENCVEYNKIKKSLLEFDNWIKSEEVHLIKGCGIKEEFVAKYMDLVKRHSLKTGCSLLSKIGKGAKIREICKTNLQLVKLVQQMVKYR